MKSKFIGQEDNLFYQVDWNGDGFEFFSFRVQDQCTVVGDEGFLGAVQVLK